MKVFLHIASVLVLTISCRGDEPSIETQSEQSTESQSSFALDSTSVAASTHWVENEKTSELYDQFCPNKNASYMQVADSNSIIHMTYASSRDACEDMVKIYHREARQKVEAACQAVGGSFFWTENNEWNDQCAEYTYDMLGWTKSRGWGGGMTSFGVCCSAKHAPHSERIGSECEDMEYSQRPMRTVFSRTAVGHGSSDQSCQDAKVNAMRASLEEIQKLRSECRSMPNTEFFESDPFHNPDGCWSGWRPVKTDFATIFDRQGICCQRFSLGSSIPTPVGGNSPPSTQAPRTSTPSTLAPRVGPPASSALP